MIYDMMRWECLEAVMRKFEICEEFIILVMGHWDVSESIFFNTSQWIRDRLA